MMISPPEPCGPGGEDREEKILQIANGNCQLVLNDETFPGEFPQHFKNPLKKNTLVLFFGKDGPTFFL